MHLAESSPSLVKGRFQTRSFLKSSHKRLNNEASCLIEDGDCGKMETAMEWTRIVNLRRCTRFHGTFHEY